MSRVWMSHVRQCISCGTFMDEAGHTVIASCIHPCKFVYIYHGYVSIYIYWIRHITCVNESCPWVHTPWHIHGWGWSHCDSIMYTSMYIYLRMSHVTCVHGSCHMSEWILSHLCMIDHTCDRPYNSSIMSGTNFISHVTHAGFQSLCLFLPLCLSVSLSAFSFFLCLVLVPSEAYAWLHAYQQKTATASMFCRHSA